MYEYLNKLYWQRNPQSVKSDFGKCLVIAGSKKYPGASFIACQMAELAGPGYVALAVPESIYLSSINQISPNSIHESFSVDDDFCWEEGLEARLNLYDAILFGNGVNNSLSNLHFLKNLLTKYDGNLVIDGTGLRLLADNLEILEHKNPKINILLTPHLGEASHLLKCSNTSRNPLDYLNLALDFANKYQVNILLKSYSQILVLKNQKYLQSTYKPIPALAKAGSGDALAGLITGFLAYATKIYSYEEVIFKSDSFFHLLGIVAQDQYSSGLTSSHILAEALVEIVKAAKTKICFMWVEELIESYSL